MTEDFELMISPPMLWMQLLQWNMLWLQHNCKACTEVGAWRNFVLHMPKQMPVQISTCVSWPAYTENGSCRVCGDVDSSGFLLQRIEYGVIGTQLMYDDLQCWGRLFLAACQSQSPSWRICCCAFCRSSSTLYLGRSYCITICSVKPVVHSISVTSCDATLIPCARTAVLLADDQVRRDWDTATVWRHAVLG